MKENKNLFFSPAKINLFLEVLSKRNDSYHNLNSLMCFCNIGDYLEIKECREFFFEIDGPFKGSLNEKDNNLVKKAIEKLEDLTKKRFKVKIKLVKNLPISSGLGGGSSNAATVLKFLIKRFNFKIEKKILDEFLLELGSDVPFCFNNRSAIIQGIGNIIRPISNIPEYPILIVNPLKQVSTKEIFENVKIFNNSKTVMPENFTNDAFLGLLKNSSNDLEKIAIKLHPEIYEILKIFKNKTDSFFSRMSGSGASCFGLFENCQKLKEAEKIFSNINRFWWISSGNLLNQI